jgi:pSer/pThr/pTyr-binding forkhead associated (FHA) protein
VSGSPPARVSLELSAHHDAPPRSATLSGGSLLIGREEGDLRIEDLLVSRRHATLTIEDEGTVVLRDLESTNGTFLNGRLLTTPMPVRDGDDIRIGAAHLRVRIGPA